MRGRKFREWLRYQYFEKMESGCNAEAMQVAVETIAAKAQYQGDERQGGGNPWPQIYPQSAPTNRLFQAPERRRETD